MAAATLLLGGCKNSGGEKILPGVSGKAGEVAVVCSKTEWESEPGSTLRALLSDEMPYLPQVEPMYDLFNVPQQAFNKIFQVHRNIIVIDTDKKYSSAAMRIWSDVWARPQLVIEIDAPDAAQAAEIISQKGQKILSQLEITERSRVLANINGEARAREILSQIKETVVEKTEPLFAYGFLVIFIGCMLSVFQQIIGINAVLYFAPRIFESLGVTDNMLFTVIMGIINISFTLVAVFTVEKLGRKPLLISGSIGMAIGAFAVALSNIAALPAWVPVAGIMLYSASFMFSWGPICWVYISELFPNTIRSQATAVAVAFQWVFNFIVSSTFVPLYNHSHFVAYALYGIICVAAAIFVWRLVPETKGKTLEEMSRLWKQ